MVPSHRIPSPPGKILLEEFLDPLNLSLESFASRLGNDWNYTSVKSLINGEKAINKNVAESLANVLGTSPEFWVGLQEDIDHWHALEKKNSFLQI